MTEPDISDSEGVVPVTTQTQTTQTQTPTSVGTRQQSNVGWSGYAIAGFVLSLLGLFGVGSVLGIIFGVIGRRRAQTSGQKGEGLAVAAIIVGIVTLLAFIAMAVTGNVHFYARSSHG
jgi:hypothetical protein